MMAQANCVIHMRVRWIWLWLLLTLLGAKRLACRLCVYTTTEDSNP